MGKRRLAQYSQDGWLNTRIPKQPLAKKSSYRKLNPLQRFSAKASVSKNQCKITQFFANPTGLDDGDPVPNIEDSDTLVEHVEKVEFIGDVKHADVERTTSKCDFNRAADALAGEILGGCCGQDLIPNIGNVVPAVAARSLSDDEEDGDEYAEECDEVDYTDSSTASDLDVDYCVIESDDEGCNEVDGVDGKSVDHLDHGLNLRHGESGCGNEGDVSGSSQDACILDTSKCGFINKILMSKDEKILIMDTDSQGDYELRRLDDVESNLRFLCENEDLRSDADVKIVKDYRQTCDVHSKMVEKVFRSVHSTSGLETTSHPSREFRDVHYCYKNEIENTDVHCDKGETKKQEYGQHYDVDGKPNANVLSGMPTSSVLVSTLQSEHETARVHYRRKNKLKMVDHGQSQVVNTKSVKSMNTSVPYNSTQAKCLTGIHRLTDNRIIIDNSDTGDIQQSPKRVSCDETNLQLIVNCSPGFEEVPPKCTESAEDSSSPTVSPIFRRIHFENKKPTLQESVPIPSNTQLTFSDSLALQSFCPIANLEDNFTLNVNDDVYNRCFLSQSQTVVLQDSEGTDAEAMDAFRGDNLRLSLSDSILLLPFQPYSLQENFTLDYLSQS